MLCKHELEGGAKISREWVRPQLQWRKPQLVVLARNTGKNGAEAAVAVCRTQAGGGPSGCAAACQVMETTCNVCAALGAS
jgi:hypothetical protein